MMNDTDLSGLVASRICHDLISPVGAIGNGLELLEMAPGDGAEEATLIRQSADAATASLKFMRIAFGAATPADVMAMAEAARIFVAYLAQGRRRATWAAAAGGLARTDAQVLFLGALALADTAPLGGQMTVETAQSEPFRADIVITSPRITAAADPADPPTPRDAHRLLFDRLCAEGRISAVWDVAPAAEIGLGEGYARLTLTGR